MPDVKPFAVYPIIVGIEFEQSEQTQRNPNAPIIEPVSAGVGNAVILLRGVDATQARPWNHPPVRVEIADFHFRINQLAGQTGYGFVRRGDAVGLVSRHKMFHMLHADGAAFFTLAFPEPEKPLQRRLLEPGVVELSSAACYFWMRAYLFVDDHPYYTCTTADGRFTLSDVPPGDYELVCWLPNWNSAGRDLDPESGVVLRHFYQLPLTKSQAIRVETAETATAEFAVAEADFKK